MQEVKSNVQRVSNGNAWRNERAKRKATLSSQWRSVVVMAPSSIADLPCLAPHCVATSAAPLRALRSAIDRARADVQVQLQHRGIFVRFAQILLYCSTFVLLRLTVIKRRRGKEPSTALQPCPREHF